MQAQAASQHGNILVVDDNRMNRMTLQHMLAEQGHTVTLATNGREALDLLRNPAAGAHFDVVLLDLLMPGIDGFQVLQTIQSDPTLRGLVVIVISALDEMESIVRCIELGAEDYLPKPFEPVILRARLKASLERKKLRDLERSYLQQELVLRQSEKLATLGRLSAGVAHELNNPAAAAQRSAGALAQELARMQQAQRQLTRDGLTSPEEAALEQVLARITNRVAEPLILDSLTRTDREEEVEGWLRKQRIRNGWEIAADLVAMGYQTPDLAQLATAFAADKLPTVVAWISATYSLHALAKEISATTARISEIIGALKSYTYMDQAPVQQVNVHKGLEDTLTMLHSKLGNVEVQREYAEQLPLVEAYGSELNQVWTNLIDNAIAAMPDGGLLRLRTVQADNWVIVAVEDTGHGIPAEIQGKVFDPFFTTKPPGEGTGLGLNIAHNIIVQRHKGRITVDSHPGMTRFEVCLPIPSG